MQLKACMLLLQRARRVQASIALNQGRLILSGPFHEHLAPLLFHVGPHWLTNLFFPCTRQVYSHVPMQSQPTNGCTRRWVTHMNPGSIPSSMLSATKCHAVVLLLPILRKAAGHDSEGSGQVQAISHTAWHCLWRTRPP